MRGLIIAGIGTDVGKTVVSAVVCEALNADYWKPLASGLDTAKGDDESVAALIKNGKDRVHPSTYRFKRALSPHIAAALEGETICLERLMLPSSDRPIVVELAGGVLVPLSDDYTNMELIAKLDLPVLVVSRHYLGSINHTLLTIEALRAGAHYRQDPSTCRAPTGNYSLSCSAAEAILFNWSGSVNSSTPS